MYGRTELRKNFFGVRVMDDWKATPPELEKVTNTEEFKRKYGMLRATQMYLGRYGNGPADHAQKRRPGAGNMVRAGGWPAQHEKCNRPIG